jgi:hypothetical protein
MSSCTFPPGESWRFAPEQEPKAGFLPVAEPVRRILRDPQNPGRLNDGQVLAVAEERALSQAIKMRLAV